MIISQRMNGLDALKFMRTEICPDNYNGGVFTKKFNERECLISHLAKKSMLPRKLQERIDDLNFCASAFKADTDFRRMLADFYGYGADVLFTEVASYCGTDYKRFIQHMEAFYDVWGHYRTVDYTVTTKDGKVKNFSGLSEATSAAETLKSFGVDATIHKTTSEKIR